ncbi:MAG: hypothetical protein K0Q49_1728 [Haloplasmataceae bacterium]|jgi:putative membrane protein insertion efficiency factor|nr:hypothetical protein [Haloplasmataceae bacterium]
MFNKLFIKLIKFYIKYISKFLGNNCRFVPTCSHYGIEAYQKHNFFYATFLTVKRIIRCNPLTKPGFDPVPEKIKNIK